MNPTVRNLLFLLLLVPALASCIRDEVADCPPLILNLVIKDKNYFNVDEVAAKGLITKKDENLPFREYVSTLYYTICNEAGDTVAARKLLAVTGHAKTEVISLPADLPYGKYRVTVWGNLKSEAPLAQDGSSANLEHADAEGRDIYLANAEVNYAFGTENHTVELQRTKGLLIIQAENLPDDINLSEKTITNVYSLVAAGLKYDRLTNLTSRTPWTDKHCITTYTLTGPSKGLKQSTLQMAFLADSPTPEAAPEPLRPDDIQITMERNFITVVKYVYRTDNDFTIYVLVNDNWEEVHGLIVEE